MAIPSLIRILNLDITDLLVKLLRQLNLKRKPQTPEGMYEVLDYDAQLELCDEQGKKAICHKRQRVLISLPIRSGFSKKHESFQVDVNHRTQAFTFSVIFPKSRHPKRVVLHEQNHNRTTVLDGSHLVRLPDDRLQARWYMNNPWLLTTVFLARVPKPDICADILFTVVITFQRLHGCSVAYFNQIPNGFIVKKTVGIYRAINEQIGVD